MSTDKNMEWMYEGAKSLVNREDYLLGKRIDKNFELYSDVVVKEKDHQAELFAKKPEQTASTSTMSLPVLVIRQDDPLAAMKIQQAKRREELLNNPAFKLKAEKMLRKEFEKAKHKAERKALKKQLKKEKKKRKERSSTESSSTEEEKQLNKRRRSDSKETPGLRRRRSSSHDKQKRQRSVSPERKHSSSRRRRSSSGSENERRHRRSRDRSVERRPNIKRHRSRSRDRSRSNERRPNTQRRRSRSRDRSRSNERRRDHRQQGSSSKAEEMARRLKEMQDNAKWKEQVRQDNVNFASKELEKDANTDDNRNARNAVFIKAFKQRTESSTVADKIQQKRNRMRIDRDDD
ncbi:hypothetical protein M3Y97_00641300 [Aphelenchoides bicaudatus]|nr:hypothetical protein M3Y97_00641300 [Aphelenchoides bicaudatus]